MGTTTNILVGAHSSVKMAYWITGRVAHSTLVDLGFTMGGVTFDPKTELHLVEVDQHLAHVAAEPRLREAEVKFKLLEATPENIRIALAQPLTNITGTPPDVTLSFDADAPAQYYQLQFAGKGHGTTAVRTWTFWRTYIKAITGYQMGKDTEQALDVTVGILQETTGSGTASLGKLVET